MTVNKEICHRVIHRLICATRSRVRSKIGSLQRNLTFEWSLFRGKSQEGGRHKPVSYTQIPKPLLGDFFELILCFMI